MNSAIQELTDELKRVKPMGVPLDLEYDYDYYIEMDKNDSNYATGIACINYKNTKTCLDDPKK